MTKKEFMKSVTNGEVDILQELLELLNQMQIDYCVIGGLAVNAYVEPVVSLDLDIIIVADKLIELCQTLEKKFTFKEFPHSINLESPKSDLRVQIQTDPRYQPFIKRATTKQVMGYKMKVAKLEDVLQGKVWAYSDTQRRPSKRQKDLADIFRLIEGYPNLQNLLPESIKSLI